MAAPALLRLAALLLLRLALCAPPPRAARAPAVLRALSRSPLPPPPALARQSDGEGMTAFLCREDADCVAPRTCVRVAGDNIRKCNNHASALCMCFPVEQGPQSCTCSRECVPGELCAFGTDPPVDPMCMSEYIATRPDGFTLMPKCPGEGGPPPEGNANPPGPASPAPASAPDSPGTPRPSPASGSVSSNSATRPPPDEQSDGCVDAAALAHLRPAQLVFAVHKVARVLCDDRGSCATPGHLVVFRGAPMMMRTYCGMTACEPRVMRVNSPRVRRALRVPSHTRGLEYTAFAARHETKLEEAVLVAAVRVGL